MSGSGLPGAMRPAWSAPVHALMSTRAGGVSGGPYGSLNLGSAVADDPVAVAENQRRFAAALGATPVWLEQVHGARVVRLTDDHAAVARPPERADASVSAVPGLACAVRVADCLPVLLAAADGRAVGAVHAGWRGLAAGIVEAAVEALCEMAHCEPSSVHAWLGPCIGPRAFEVGADVVEAFGGGARFSARRRADGSPGWLADLAGLARDRLAAKGVGSIRGGEWCTVEDRSRFFSFRRDGVTGRMAAAVAVRG